MNLKSDWRFVRWNYVKSIASNDLTRVIVLVPLAGYLILFNDQIASMASFETIAGVNKNDASPFIFGSLTKLRMVFFGSLFVLFSFLIYKVFRPEPLDNTKDDLEFSTQVLERYSVYEIAKIEKQVYSDNWKARTKSFWFTLGLERRKEPVVSGYRPNARAQMFSKHGDYIHFLAREWWVGMMHTYRVARITSAIFGVLGYIFLAIPTLDIAQAVFRKIFI